MSINYKKEENREETEFDRQCDLLLYIRMFFTKIRKFKLIPKILARNFKHNKILELVKSDKSVSLCSSGFPGTHSAD